jgi:hypothetical protein
MDDNPREGAPDTSGPKIIRPIPRRPFKLGGFSSPTPPEEDDEHTPQRPQISASDLRFLAPHQHTTIPRTRSRDGSTPLSHTTSYLNLTSPTLFGIYSPSTLSGSFTKDEDAQDQDQDGDGDRGQYFPSVDGNDSDGDILASGTGTPGPQPDLDEETYSLIRKRSRSRRSSTLLPSQPTTTTIPSQYITRTRQQRKRVVALQLVLRAALLFALGVGYGILVTRLPQNTHHLPHSSQRLAAYESHYEWRYLAVWGAAGVALGSLLPWFDRFWEARTTKPSTTQKSTTTTTTPTRTAPPPHRADDDDDSNNEETAEEPPHRAGAGAAAADYPLVIRGIGAFVGIVFAIRKLPWASTMQVSLTLALANPFLWYLIDRSKPGFLLSAAVGLAGSAVLMGLDLGEGVMPAPAAGGAAILEDGFGTGGNATAAAAAGGYVAAGNGGAFGGLASQETIETSIWMLSVLFCSCVCFGNIGRRLALNSSAAGRGRWGGVR